VEEADDAADFDDDEDDEAMQPILRRRRYRVYAIDDDAKRNNENGQSFFPEPLPVQWELELLLLVADIGDVLLMIKVCI
jgi:hypothetical protein